MRLAILKKICISCITITCVGMFAVGLLSMAPLVFDRQAPYVVSDLTVGSSFPGDVVPLTARFTQTTPGRSCWVVANPQALGSGDKPKAAPVSVSRLISGLLIQEQLKKTGDRFYTDVQIPHTMPAGVGEIIIELDMGCDDNPLHKAFPINRKVRAAWIMTPRPQKVDTNAVCMGMDKRNALKR